MQVIKKNIFSVIFICIGVLMCLSPHWLFPICTKLRPDGTPMSCFYTAKLVIALGGALAVINVMTLFVTKKMMKYSVYFLNIIIACIGIALPNRIIPVGDMKTLGWQIAYCQKPGMMCNHTLKPELNVILPMIIVLSALAIVVNFLKGSDYNANNQA